MPLLILSNKMKPRLTDSFDDASERLLHVSCTGVVGLDIVGDGCELAATHVLTDGRHSLLHAAGHVVATVGHASRELKMRNKNICMSKMKMHYLSLPSSVSLAQTLKQITLRETLQKCDKYALTYKIVLSSELKVCTIY